MSGRSDRIFLTWIQITVLHFSPNLVTAWTLKHDVTATNQMPQEYSNLLQHYRL